MRIAKPTVSIVIPNWNGVDLMKKHLAIVVASAPRAQIIVADDASTDGSVEFLKKNFPKVQVVTRNKREGFAANVNSGVKKANGDIILLLNTDVAPQKDFLEPIISHFSDPQIFAVGCLEKSPEKDGVVLRGRGLARWEKGFYIHSRGEVEKSNTAWVAGGSGAFRKSMWESLGGMDTIYNPFYWEDIDLSYRARKAGWKILFEPNSIVHHYHEEGKIKREYSSAYIKRVVYRNQFIFIWKNLSDSSILLSHAFWTPIRLLQTLLSGDTLMFQGYILALARLPTIAMHRSNQRKLWTVNDRELQA